MVFCLNTTNNYQCHLITEVTDEKVIYFFLLLLLNSTTKEDGQILLTDFLHHNEINENKILEAPHIGYQMSPKKEANNRGKSV
jgi:hypothetical protein